MEVFDHISCSLVVFYKARPKHQLSVLWDFFNKIPPESHRKPRKESPDSSLFFCLSHPFNLLTSFSSISYSYFLNSQDLPCPSSPSLYSPRAVLLFAVPLLTCVWMHCVLPIPLPGRTHDELQIDWLINSWRRRNMVRDADRQTDWQPDSQTDR